MRHFFHFVFLFLFFVLIGCNTPGELKIKKYNINSSIVEIDSSLFGNPGRLMLSDSLFFISDDVGGFYFAVFDIKNKKFLKRFGKKGKGPNEIITPFNTFMYKGKFAFKTLNTENIATININDILTKSDPVINIIAKLREEKKALIHTNVIPLKNDNQFLSTGFFSNGKYAVIDIKNGTDSIFGTYSIPNVNMNQFNTGHIFQTGIIHHPSQKKIVNIGRVYDQIEIITYNDKGDYDIVTNNPSFQPEINYKSKPYRLSRSSRFAFLDISVTVKYIYILYSGKTYQEHGNGVFLSNKIHVYDWDLNKKCEYELNHEISSFIVTADDRHLYSFALSDNSELDLVKWDLIHH
ncbi:BF3164 family lipoprotein [Geofilum sp. OHC36d9]|uniref:BF3164 family lipoprotein n=1 Tax=Geofilum sp. OHC36d9 TaxID=3458413 RepID=UPI004033BFD9